MKEPNVLCNFKDICRDEAELIPSGKFGTSDPLVQRECSNCGCGEVTQVPGGNLVYCPNCGRRYVNSDREKRGVEYIKWISTENGVKPGRFYIDLATPTEKADVIIVKPGEACVIRAKGRTEIWKNQG